MSLGFYSVVLLAGGWRGVGRERGRELISDHSSIL